MKKVLFSLFVIGLGFSANAQNQESASPASNTPGVKKETTVSTSNAASEAAAEARITEMRTAVKNLEMRKQAIANDKSLTPEARKAKLEELYKEHDKLSQKLREDAIKN
ncbi:MAG: hypothetical protein EOO01_09300 [Chitinophagaceae bacterium]|nr:MAG: hypothetical protein EOO01_09300 [Chitinophagaceae bacterium]